MKNLIYILLFAFSINKSVSQVNLIYNPSFEFTVSCPGLLGQISTSSGWNWNGASADYFHPCTFNNVGVPYNVCGYQQPYSGIAYAGFITYSTFTSNYREYFGTVLTTSLSVGTKYFFSLKTSNSYNPSYYNSLATNNIGIRLFTNNPGGLTPNNNPKLNFTSIVVDSVNWTHLSGSFIADSNYTYLAIGNYYNDLSTSTVAIGPNAKTSYYYIEDVCLSTDSLLCNSIVTGENNILLNEEISFYPQPTKDIVNINLINSFNKNIEIKITDITGKEIEKKELEVSQGKTQFSTLHLPNGIYILQLKNSQGQVAVKRLVVSK